MDLEQTAVKHDVKQAVRRQFGAAADAYAESFVHSRGPDLEAMVAAVELRGDERVLDLGCGAGHTAFAFAPRVREVVGLDLTESMLERARAIAANRGLANARFELGDAEGMPFPDASFDLVTSRQCAHHFADPAAALCEVARVLRPSGILLLVDSVSPDEPAADAFLDGIERLRDPSHVRDYTLGEWGGLLGKAGFTAEHLESWRLRLDFADWVARMRTPSRAVDELRARIDNAAPAIRRTLGLGEPGHHDFDMPVALLRARRISARALSHAEPDPPRPR